MGIINVNFIVFCLGLVAVGEKAQKRSGHYVVMKDLSGEILTCLKKSFKIIALIAALKFQMHFIFKVNIQFLRWWRSVTKEDGHHLNLCWWMIVGLIIANTSSLRCAWVPLFAVRFSIKGDVHSCLCLYINIISHLQGWLRTAKQCLNAKISKSCFCKGQVRSLKHINL